MTQCIQDELINAIMEQAQVFASTYRLAGGRFDDGTKFEQSQLEKDDLRALITRAILSERQRHQWQPIDTANKGDEELMLGIMRNGAMKEIHIGGFQYAVFNDEESCWWSDQSDDEIVPTHWCLLPVIPAPPAAMTQWNFDINAIPKSGELWIETAKSTVHRTYFIEPTKQHPKGRWCGLGNADQIIAWQAFNRPEPSGIGRKTAFTNQVVDLPVLEDVGGGP